MTERQTAAAKHKSKFIRDVEARAKRRGDVAQRSADAHVQVWHELRAEQERATVRASVARTRRLVGATGEPPAVTPVPHVTEVRDVPNPSYTAGLYYGDSESARERNMRATPTGNAMTRLGALCFVRAAHRNDPQGQPGKRYPFHDEAAERFKSGYEALFGAGVPALDNSKPVVDTSPTAHDGGLAQRIDRGAKMRKALAFLDSQRAGGANTLIDFLILCTPCEAYAARMPSGRINHRQVTALVEERLGLLASLAVHWRLASPAVIRQRPVGTERVDDVGRIRA